MDIKAGDIPDRLPYEVFLPVTKNVVSDIKTGYYISNYARVYSTISKKYIKTRIVSTGYYVFNVACDAPSSEKTLLLHRILMMTFMPVDNMADLIVNHKDGVKTHTFLPNLEWTDSKGNTVHARDMGLLKPRKGETHPCAKISELQCRSICVLLESGMYRQKEIAKIAGVSLSIVESIKQGTAWKHISKEYNINAIHERISRVFSYKNLCDVCEYFQNNPRPIEMSIRQYCQDALTSINFENISESTINSIRKLYKKERWKFIYSNYNY